MKKALSLLLALVLCLSLCACGKDYSKHQFTFFGDNFSWDMTEEETYEYRSKNQLIKNEIEISRICSILDAVIRYYEETENMAAFEKWQTGKEES